MRERKRNRLLGFDYSKDNLYFVTSCVQDRLCCLGDISDGKMHLNEYGKIACQQFLWLEKQYSYVVLHEFVVMPNHVHAIIEINRNIIKTNDNNVVDCDPSPIKIKSLSELMGAYKMTTSKQIHLAGFPEFQWQRSFHDRIVGNDGSYGFIMNYIENNPKNWQKDDIFPNE